MLFSIITPNYNCCKFLKANIESLLAQSHTEYEHIVLDGGSDDGSVELLKNYPHIKWESQPDNGMYDAINKGIKMSSGEILAYLNADDRYYPYSLEIVNEIFTKYPDVDFVYGYCLIMDEDEKPLYTLRALPWMPRIAKKSRYTWTQQSCFWRKQIHKKVGLFDDSFRYLADRDFFIRMINCGLKGRLIRKPLAKFMRRKLSLERALTLTEISEKSILESRYKKNRFHIFNIFNEAFFKILNVRIYFWRTIYRLRGRIC